LDDLKSAMQVIKHKPDDETIEAVCQKLDVDQDGFVVSSGVVLVV
jgi:LETM1 and EF-hand domain-containing protein 1